MALVERVNGMHTVQLPADKKGAHKFSTGDRNGVCLIASIAYSIAKTARRDICFPLSVVLSNLVRRILQNRVARFGNASLLNRASLLLLEGFGQKRKVAPTSMPVDDHECPNLLRLVFSSSWLDDSFPVLRHDTML